MNRNYCLDEYSLTDVRKLHNAFDDLRNQVKYEACNDNTVFIKNYEKSLKQIYTICANNQNDEKITLILQDRLYLVGSAIRDKGNVALPYIASDFVFEMGKILVNANFTPENQFRIFCGLARATEESRFQLQSGLNGTMSTNNETLLGLLLENRSLTGLSAFAGLLSRRMFKLDAKMLNGVAYDEIDGVYNALKDKANCGIDSFSHKLAIKLLGDVLENNVRFQCQNVRVR